LLQKNTGHVLVFLFILKKLPAAKWPTEFVVESASTAEGPWSLLDAAPTVKDDQHMITVAVDARHRFFRVRREWCRSGRAAAPRQGASRPMSLGQDETEWLGFDNSEKMGNSRS
jgi:hypothetical protein